MEKSRKKIMGLSGLIALGMVAAFMIGASVQMAAFAAPSAQSGAKDKPTEVEKIKANPLADLFISKFAARLGVDAAKLDAALVGAVEDTATQALKSGLITQDDVTVARKIAQGGFKAFIEQGFSIGSHKRTEKLGDDLGGFNPKGALITGAAKALGLTEDALLAEMTGGKSFADLAAARNVSMQTLKDTMLAEAKTVFDAGVKAGQISQANADELYADFSTHIDQIVGTIVNSK